MDTIGHYAYVRTHREKIARAEAVVTGRALYARGRYISPTLITLIKLVAKRLNVPFDAVRGEGRTQELVHARFCVSNLALEFIPRLSANAIDDGMLRGEGSCAWHRVRHADRLRQYPAYKALFEACRAELLERQAAA